MNTGAASTRLVGLLGWPVAHSLSPAMHEAAFAALGLDLRYLAFAVEPAHLAEAIRGAAALGVLGLNVTVPHKEAALTLCEPDEEARRVGAVNTLVFASSLPAGLNRVDDLLHRSTGEPAAPERTIAPALLHRSMSERAAPDHPLEDVLLQRSATHPAGAAHPIDPALLQRSTSAALSMPRGLNTDVHGFRMLLTEAGITAAGARAVILGAGGAARAVAMALRTGGASAIDLVARRPAPFVLDGEALPVHPWAGGPDPALLGACDLLVDATPRGLDDSTPPLDLAPLPDHAAVVDLVVRPTTRLVETARARHLRAVTGEAMLLHQGARAFTAWTGLEAPLEAMRAALRAELAHRAALHHPRGR